MDFVENSIFLDIPVKYLLLAKCHCLVMFCLKIIFKNVQRLDITPEYINTVLVGDCGQEAMQLSNQVAIDIYQSKDTSYLTEEWIVQKTNVCFNREDQKQKKMFCEELRNYIKEKKNLLTKTEEPQERNTRSENFTIEDAKKACDKYIKDLWGFIRKRIKHTDFSEGPCAFTEAPAEGIFSIYDRIITGRERLSIGHAVALTRIALHGPPPATPDSASLSKSAMANFKSKFGERYCTLHWRPGATSTTVSRIQSQSWDW